MRALLDVVVTLGTCIPEDAGLIRGSNLSIKMAKPAYIQILPRFCISKSLVALERPLYCICKEMRKWPVA